MLQKLLHKYLKLPHRLHVRYDSKLGSKTIVLIHGIAASGTVWAQTHEQLSTKYRVIIIDLLGFGESPKPEYELYDASTHARSIRYTLRLMGVSQFYLIGHSMGAIIALHFAHEYPTQPEGVLCVGMPAYDMSHGHKKARIRYRTNIYMRIYSAMIAHPDLTWTATQAIIRRFGPKAGLVLDKPSVVPFQLSLANTIIHQNVLDELRAVRVPTVVLYGHLDPFLIQSYYRPELINNPSVVFRRVRASHALDAGLIRAVVDEIELLANG